MAIKKQCFMLEAVKRSNVKIPELNPSYYHWLRFDPDKHKYWDTEGTYYTSVTQLLGKYKKDVFTEEFIENYASERGLTADFVKTKWGIKRDFSAIKGTELHFFAENYVKDGIQIETVTPIGDQKQMVVEFWDNIKDKVEVIGTEFRIASKKYSVAGTIDLLIYNKSTEKYYIMDWKSNEKIEMTGRNNLLSPFNTYQDCEFHNYSLQLSIYRYLLEEEFKCEFGESILVHVKSGATNANPIRCFYPKEQIEKILI
jgi:hypothetical protein